MTVLKVRRGAGLVSPVIGGGGAPPPVVGGFSLFGPEAGGQLSGHMFADDGTCYARTDVGGAYRKNPGATAPWVQLTTVSSIPTPLFTDVYCAAIACCPTQPSRVYMLTGTGFDPTNTRFRRSDNGGATWTEPPQFAFQVDGNGEERNGFEPMVVQHDNPDVVYVPTRRQGLLRSTDGGTSWTTLTSLPEPPAHPYHNRIGVTTVHIERGSASVSGVRQGLWATVRGRGVYRSTNGGASWTLLHTFSGSTSYAGTANYGQFASDAVLNSNGDLVVCVRNPNALVRITPAGVVTTITPPGVPHTVAVHPTNPQTMFVGADGLRDSNITQSLWRTTDGGTTWTVLDITITNGADGAVWPTQSDLASYMTSGLLRYDPADPTYLWFSEGMGMWRSNDLADTDMTLVFASNGIQELVANAILCLPGGRMAAVTWDRGLYVKSNRDVAWSLGSIGPQSGKFCSGWDVQARPDVPNTLVAVLSDHQGADLDGRANSRLSCVSLDGGATWTRLAGLANGTADPGLRFGTIAIARGSNDRLVWAPSREDPDGADLDGVRLRYSTDRGATWLTPSIPDWQLGEFASDWKYNKQRHLVADPNVTDRLWLLTDSANTGYVRRSDNGGASWGSRMQVAPSGDGSALFSAHLTAVKVGTDTRLYLTTGPRGDMPAAMNQPGQLPARMSTDLGVTWTDLPIFGAHGLGVGAPISPSTNPTLYTYGWRNNLRGVWYSTDLGASWTRMTDEPVGWHQGVSACAGDPEVPGRVYVGMPGGSFFSGQV